MIACLKGKVLTKSFDRAVIDVGGVGYDVQISRNAYDLLPETGQEAFLHVHLHVREDSLSLFGFADRDEKACFLLLQGVSGIGPRLALSILSGIRPGELARAVSTDDISRLVKLSGVGKKTAERLCLELKDKVHPLFVQPESSEQHQASEKSNDQRIPDVISALINLGYPEIKANEALISVRKQLSDEKFSNMSLEELLRRTLGSLA